MLARMPAHVFQDWRAYAEVEPFGEDREDLRTAYLAMWLYNINRDTKQAPTPAHAHEMVGHFLQEIKALRTHHEQAQEKAVLKEREAKRELTEDEEAKLSQQRSGRTQTWQEQKAIFLSWAYAAAAAHKKKQQAFKGTKRLGDAPSSA